MTTTDPDSTRGLDHGADGVFRRLDHVGIAVWDADAVIPYYRDALGLALVGDEIADERGTRLVYFQTGESFIQLVQPVTDESDIRVFLHEHGEGVHHICLLADDLHRAAETADRPDEVEIFRAGRSRNACFLSGVVPSGVRIEVTETHPSR